MRKFCFLFILSCLLPGCSLVKYENNEDTFVFDEIEKTYEYSDVASKHISFDEMFKIDTFDYYVYFYSLTCSHCEEFKNEIVEKILNRDNIYLVKGSNKIKLTNDQKSSIGAENVGDFAILGYPSMAEIKDKKVVKLVSGKTQILNLIS